MQVKYRARKERARAPMLRLGLAERIHYRPSQLSEVNSKESVLPALMNGGEVILADEPTGALDSQSGKK